MSTTGMDEIVSAYDRDGFVNAGRMIDDPLLHELKAEYARLAADDSALSRPSRERFWSRRDMGKESGEPNHPVVQVTNAWFVSSAFRRLIYDHRIVSAAARLSRAPDLQVWADQTQAKPAHVGGRTNWHQDGVYWVPLTPDIAFTAWVALDDATEENGCMWMVPGSHRWGRRTDLLKLGKLATREEFAQLHEYIELADGHRSRPCPVRAGEVHFHHCLTWHGSPRNPTDSDRIGIAIHFMPTGVCFSGKVDPFLSHVIDAEPGTPMLECGGSFFPIVRKDSKNVAPPPL